MNDNDRNKRSSNKDKKKEEKLERRFIELEDDIEKQKQTIESLQAQVELLSSRSNPSPNAPLVSR